MTQESFPYSDVLERISRFPRPPLAERLFDIARETRASVGTFAEVVSQDAQFAARLLRVANCAPGLSGKLPDLSQAIEALGWESIKGLALGLANFSPEIFACAAISAELDTGVQTQRQFWEHSVACAMIAGQLALRANCRLGSEAFTAGFLHDIGRVLLYTSAPDGFLAALAMAREKTIPSAEAETLAVGHNHLEVGGRWAKACVLAPSLCAAIGQHHGSFAIINELDEDQRRCVASVQIADSLCEIHGLGNGCHPEAASIKLWQMLGLEIEDWTAQMQKAKQEIEAIREFFGVGQRSLQNVRQTTEQETDASRGPAKNHSPSRVSKARVIPFPGKLPARTDRTHKLNNQKLTILIVEDHGSLCDMLSLYFMRYGYHVRTAGDGENALGILENEEIHLVLLDLMLPRIDGFAVLRQIRERQENKRPYVIVVSAGASTKDRSRVLEMGANEYMPKPFHLMRLLERIQNVEKYLLS